MNSSKKKMNMKMMMMNLNLSYNYSNFDGLLFFAEFLFCFTVYGLLFKTDS